MKFETIHKRIGREMIRHLPFVAVALMVSLTASAQTTKRIPLPPSQNPRNADLPIAAAVWAKDTLYVRKLPRFFPAGSERDRTSESRETQ